MSIYQKILTKYGIEAQLSHFAQEFAEAYVELVKNIRGAENENDGLEELAHLTIMTRQMIEYIDPTFESYPEIYSDEVKRLQRLLE